MSCCYRRPCCRHFHAVPGTHAVAGVSSVVGPSVTHTMLLPYSPWCCYSTRAVAGVSLLLALLLLASVACSSLNHTGKVFWPLEGDFYFPNARTRFALGTRKLFGIGKWTVKRYFSSDQKTFPAFMGECKKNSVNGWKHVPHWKRAFPSLVMEFSNGKLKQDTHL